MSNPLDTFYHIKEHFKYGLDRKSIIKNSKVDKALNGLIDIILVKSISRFGRNITDVIGAINKLRTKGVEVFFERENISRGNYQKKMKKRSTNY